MAPAAPIEVGRTLDVSEAGLRVETTRELLAGQDLELQIAAGDRLISAKGRVVHLEPTGTFVLTGIEWVDISAEDLAFLVGLGPSGD
jgi:hypothetical protein